MYATQSVTLKPSKAFNTPLGYFSFTHIAKEAYPIGLVQIKEDGVTYVMASPEKALCDLVANTPGLNLRFKTEAMKFLEEDLRFDMERFVSFDRDILAAYTKVGKKANSIQTILKLLNNE